MDECELIALITAVSCAITKCCSNDEITILAAVFSQISSTLTTVLAQRDIRESKAGQNVNNQISDNINPALLADNPPVVNSVL